MPIAASIARFMMPIPPPKYPPYTATNNSNVDAPVTAAPLPKQAELPPPHHRRSAGIVLNSRRNPSRKELAKSKQQRRAEQQPWQYLQESLRRRLDQENRSGQPSHHAGQYQWNHHAPRNVQPHAVGPAAGGRPHPKRQRIRGVGRHGRHTRKQKRRKRHKTTTTSDGVNSPSECPGEKQKYSGV